MSETVPAPASPTTAPPSPVRSMILADAQGVPSAIRMAETADPQLADFLKGKALLASKSVWFPPATALVTLAVTKYGLGWDADTITAVTTLLVLGASAVCRLVTHSPITGLISKGTPKT
ncbi:MAG: hypothetical protein P4L90_25770 [Rhodopila sp.]|nr:hypothetical protein [Rhodopila sp.]